jgi:hypothetical protein
MPKKKTQLQLDYEKEYKRLVKGFSKYQKQGYIFPEQTVIKTLQELRKNVTKY